MTWKCTGFWMGCDRQFTEEEFASWDELTRRETDISGLCDRCQDVVFAEPDDYEVDCNCQGLYHLNDCPNWEMPF